MPESYPLDEADWLIVEQLLPSAPHLRWVFSDWREFILSATYVSALGQCHAILRIIDSGLGYHSYPLARGMLGAAVDIQNTIEIEPYYLNKVLKFHINTRKESRDASEGNPYLASVGRLDNLTTLIEEESQIIERLRNDGAQELTDFRRLELAGRVDECRALYRSFSDHAHLGIGALIASHADFQGAPESISMGGFEHNSSSEFLAMTTTVFEALRDTTFLVHNYKSTGVQSEISRATNERFSL